MKAYFDLALVGEMAARRMGDPLASDTEVGPLARHDLREASVEVKEQSGGGRGTTEGIQRVDHGVRLVGPVGPRPVPLTPCGSRSRPAP